jgi:hypothetical protein
MVGGRPDQRDPMTALDKIGAVQKNREVSMPTPDQYKMFAHPSSPPDLQTRLLFGLLFSLGVISRPNFHLPTSRDVTEG